MNFLLLRDLDDGRCSQGTIVVNGETVQTLERPWVPGPRGGTKGVSCVPTGIYNLVRHDTEAHPRSFALVNEAIGVYHFDIPEGGQGRTACLIHVANVPEELRGCIALGMERDRDRINRSKVAVEKFYSFVPWTYGHTLEIRNS